jgi:integrase
MTNDTTKGPSPKRKGGRPRKGTLEMRGETWHARLTVTVAGEVIRQWRDTGTNDKTAARRKLARWVKESAAGTALPNPDAAKAPETVASYAEGWIDSRRRRGIASADYEARIFERVWKPTIGHMALGAVMASHIRGVLDDAATGRLLPVKRKGQTTEPKPYSRQTVAHIRATIFRLFDSAWRDELISENRVARVSVPEMVETKKPRAVLSDPEIVALVSHPDVDAEIKVLLLLSRCIGGIRSGDLNAMTWDAFSPGFEVCTLVRRKTRKKRSTPEPFEVPEMARPFVAAWWERQGRPAAGPVFPVRKGERAGLAKKATNMSYADRLRRELARAGIVRHELHHETATTLPVDFHSTRRAYAQALARIGLNAQEAARLTGHADLDVHQRYLESAAVRVLPSAAVPYVDPTSAALVANRNRPKLGAKPARPADAANDADPLQTARIAVRSDHLSGTSSVGRARASQARGHGFESRVPLRKNRQIVILVRGAPESFCMVRAETRKCRGG